MLRDSLKGAICGLIVIALCGCSSTRPLLDSRHEELSLCNVKIKADPRVEYQISGIINRLLPHYVKNPKDYFIAVTIKESSSSAVYTQRQVAKEQLRMAASVVVYDREYNELGSRLVDSFSTYEVCDDLPYSVLASKNQAWNTVSQELANSIVMAVVSITTN